MCEPVEHIEGEPTVDFPHDGPSQIDEALQFNVFVKRTFLVHALQQAIVVGTEIELKL